MTASAPRYPSSTTNGRLGLEIRGLDLCKLQFDVPMISHYDKVCLLLFYTTEEARHLSTPYKRYVAFDMVLLLSIIDLLLACPVTSLVKFRYHGKSRRYRNELGRW